VEPLDPVAGHIPGALNRPFSQNIGPDGKFKSPRSNCVKSSTNPAGGTRPGYGVVHHCGSGVSAVPNVIAMELAGFRRAGLYAGSWSDWCSDPERPVAQG
jgi:thiosulfate/3-mercaptopyruvate sulfurtransferase